MRSHSKAIDKQAAGIALELNAGRWSDLAQCSLQPAMFKTYKNRGDSLTDHEQQILSSLQRQYDTLHGKLPELLAPASQCNLAQKTQYANAVNQAQTNLVNAQNSILGREEVLILRINADVQKAEQAVDAALSSLSNISQSLDKMTHAVGDVTTALKFLA